MLSFLTNLLIIALHLLWNGFCACPYKEIMHNSFGETCCLASLVKRKSPA